MRIQPHLHATIGPLCAAAAVAIACTGSDAPSTSPTPAPRTATATSTSTPPLPRTPTPPRGTAPPAASQPPPTTPLPAPRPTPDRFTIQLIDFDSPEAVGIRRNTGLITATVNGVTCTTVDADALEPPAIVLGAPDQPAACREEGAWVSLFTGSEPALGFELWEHFRLRIGTVALLGNYATGTPSGGPDQPWTGVAEYSGVLVFGFEIAAFFPGNCPTSADPYWLALGSESGFVQSVIELSGGPEPEPFGLAMYRTRFTGERSPIGTYGHLAQYRYEVVPSELISAEPAEDCDWAASSVYRYERSLWTAWAIRDYRFTFQRACECPVEWSSPTEVTVRAGLITSATIEGGVPAPEGAAFTIDDLLDEIASALNQPVATAVTYHEELGYPLEVQLDLEAIAVDGGLSLTVTEFERLE